MTARCCLCGALARKEWTRFLDGKRVCADERACDERVSAQRGQLSLTPEHDPLKTADVQLRIDP